MDEHSSRRRVIKIPMVLPMVQWRGRVTRENVRRDLVAGVTGAVIAVPQCVAFATIAGMPAEYGLYTGMVPAVIAALFGSSWHLVSGPTTAASIVLFSILAAHAEPGSAPYVQMAITLTFLVGGLQLLMGLLRLGVLIQFVSHSVVMGFTAGAALLIASNQLGSFIGLAIPQGSSFTETLLYAATHWQDMDLYTLGVGMATLGTGIASRIFWPKAPYMLIALLGGTLASLVLIRTVDGAASHIALAGTLPTSLPPLSMPDWSQVRTLASPALAVTLLALTEAISIARAIASRTGQTIDGNQEFIGQGLSNLVGSFFSAYVATGSFNRSGVNYAAGAKTPLAAIFGGVFLALLTPVAAPVMAYLPHASMAGVLFIVAWGLIDFHHIIHVLRTSVAESIIVLVTFAATLTIGLEAAILAGAVLSLLLYLRRTSQPRVVVRIPQGPLVERRFSSDGHLPQCPQVRLVRIDGSLYYGAIEHVQRVMHELEKNHPGQNHVAVIASGINFIDSLGAEFLAEEAKRARRAGGDFYLIRVKQPVHARLLRTGCLQEIGEDHIFVSKSQAIEAIVGRLDADRCRCCRQRIFLE